jgi:hypothetical protein
MTEASGSNDLERLLVAAANDPAERPAFAQALLVHDVFVLGRSDPPPVNGLLALDAKVYFTSLKDDRGTVLPFFTSETQLQEAVAAWPGTDPAFLCLPCRAFFEITRGSRLVLNPNAPFGKDYEPAEVAGLLDGGPTGLEEVAVEEEQEVLVGAPRVTPPELPAALARYFVQRPMVEAAHLGWWIGPDGHQGYLVGIVTPDSEAAMDGFGLLEVEQLTGGATLDIGVFPPGSDDAMLTSLPPPFYVRSPQADVDGD